MNWADSHALVSSGVAWAVAIAVVAALAFAGAWLYHLLVRDRNLVREGWSGVDVQLKRRHDLIPNLVEAVRAYASHERATLEAVAALRVAEEGADPMSREEGERRVTEGLKRLFAVAEAYPDLKASADFLDLQKRLADVEDQLQMARRYYNGAVRIYNIRVESFPSNLVAGLAGFRPGDFFEVESATEREAPRVEIKP